MTPAENPGRYVDAVEAAIGRALVEVCPGRVVAESSHILVGALRNAVHAVPTTDGRTVVTGPDGRSVVDTIRDELAKPAYAGLVRPPAPTAQAAPQQQSYGGPMAAIAAGLRAAGASPAGGPLPAGEVNLGQAMIAHRVAQNQAAGDPGMNMRLPMGLKRR